MENIWRSLGEKLQKIYLLNTYRKNHPSLSNVAISAVLVLAICASLLVATPVSAVVLNLPDLPATVHTDTTYTFGAEVLIQSAEIIPITSFRLDINGTTPAWVTFDVNGTVINQNPSGIFTSIVPVSSLAVAYGNYSASGLGNQSGIIDNYTANTGYGYGSGPNPLAVPYRFNIQFHPSVFTPGNYTARLSANASNTNVVWLSGLYDLQVLGASQALEVNTLAATNVNFTSAVINGNLTGMGTASIVNVSFEFGLTDTYGGSTPVQHMNATGTFFATLVGAPENTTYHYRAKAVGDSTVYGNDMTFTTLGPVDFALLPATQSVNVGQVFNVTIQVDARAGAADEAQAYVDFNPTYIKVVDASGNILPDNATNPIIPGNSTELTVPLQNVISNTNGTADIAYGRPQVGANATNVFILGTIRFKALTNGTSIPLSFHTSGLRTTKAILAGVTVTQNQTDASVNIAPSGAQAVLRIAVNLQFREPASDPTWVTPMEVWLHASGVAWDDNAVNNGALYHFNTSTNDTGVIELNVTPGTYDIRVKGITTLKNELSNVVVAAPGPVSVSLGTLIEGDANGDNAIDISDYSLLLRYYGYDVSTSSAARLCDFDNSGFIDISDYSIILRNYGQFGADVQ